MFHSKCSQFFAIKSRIRKTYLLAHLHKNPFSGTYLSIYIVHIFFGPTELSSTLVCTVCVCLQKSHSCTRAHVSVCTLFRLIPLHHSTTKCVRIRSRIILKVHISRISLPFSNLFRHGHHRTHNMPFCQEKPKYEIVLSSRILLLLVFDMS